MNITLPSGTRSGTVTMPASKSAAHRLLILAALGESPVTLTCDGLSDDINATAGCLNALGAEITVTGNSIKVTPLTKPESYKDDSEFTDLFCGESGSTLRFLLPVTAALGINARFLTEGRLAERPLKQLTDELSSHGVQIKKEGTSFLLSGKLQPGTYTLPGNISSQFISGLLMALPLVHGDSILRITDSIESEDYISMTEEALKSADIKFEKTDGTEKDVVRSYKIYGGQNFRLPEKYTVEGDWSAAANFLVSGAFSKEGIRVCGLDTSSAQGDKKILDILRECGAEVRVEKDEVFVRRNRLNVFSTDASMIPDLVPAISVLALASKGETIISGASRLRMKESDRLESTASLLNALGADVTVLPDGLLIKGTGKIKGGTTPLCTDHRIAMAGAISACVSETPVTVCGAECSAKSYPAFFDTFNSLDMES